MKRKTTIISLLAVILCLGSCSFNKPISDKPIVSVSIAPQKYFIERIAGKLADVNIMVPNGSSPATYSPSPGQLVKLSQSKAYFAIGHLGFETVWSERLQSANDNMRWYNLSDGIELVSGHHDHHSKHDHSCSHGIDPHIWTSPKESKQLAINITNALCELFPEYESNFKKNLRDFITDIDGLDQRLIRLSKNQPDLAFMIFHPAYTYIENSYGIEQISIEFEGKTPTPARLKQTIERAKEENISTIYIQKEFDKNNAEVIAKEVQAKTVQVNPLSENWLAEMKRFISHLEEV